MSMIHQISFTIYEIVNMMMPLAYVFGFIFVLSLVVIVHEGGHFCAARWCGVRVTDFSLGFGRELWGRTDKKGTRWKVCALPLGGYVKMLGDEDAAGAKSSADTVPPDMRPFTFMAQKLWKRAIIIFAGPAMNYVFAVFVLTGVLFFAGTSEWAPIVDKVLDDSAAQEVGLQPGDRIVNINGQDIKTFPEVQRIVRVTEFGKSLQIRFERNGQLMEVTAMPHYMDGYDYPMLGYSVRREFSEPQDVGLIEAFQRSVKDVCMMTTDSLTYLWQVLTQHRPAKEMRGPLGIAEASGDAMRGGFLSLIVFIANISVAIGLMNLLPIPLLDGGHLTLYAIEAVCRRPLTEKLQNALMWVGFSILMGIVGYTFFLDIPRLVQRIFG